MPNYICMTCGVQYAESEQPPAHCVICEDERQYVKPEGQHWTTLEALRADHHNNFHPIEPNLTGIHTQPNFCISQRAYVVHTPGGNLLWECISLIDDATVEQIQALGGLTGVAISHPHFYDSMVEWSHAFGGVPIYLHADNRQWVMRPDPAIHFWEGETYSPLDGLTLIRCGGHFDGSTALHWAQGAEGRGVLLTGDTIYIASDRRYVSFMYSYPNLIPLPPRKVQAIVNAVEPYTFDRIYDGWPGKVIMTGAKEAVRRSAERYIRQIQG